MYIYINLLLHEAPIPYVDSSHKLFKGCPLCDTDRRLPHGRSAPNLLLPAQGGPLQPTRVHVGHAAHLLGSGRLFGPTIALPCWEPSGTDWRLDYLGVMPFEQ